MYGNLGMPEAVVKEEFLALPSVFAPLEWTDEFVSNIWEYYGTKAEAYFTYQFGDRILEETQGHIPENATVCDYGCGAGFLLKRLLETHQTAGIDFTRKNLEKTAHLAQNHPNLIGLFEPSECASLAESFDVIYFVETVEHLLDHHIDSTFSALANLLKPGGVVICTTPNDEDLREQEVFCPVTCKVFHRYQHMRSFTAGSLERLFANQGFTAIKTFTTDFTARTLKDRLKTRLRPALGRKNPHLVYVGHPPAA